MSKLSFVRNKVPINVGTIGHIDHGKSTLTAAIVAVQSARGLAKPMSYEQVTAGGVRRDKNKTVTIHLSHAEYETEARHYSHVDCPGHADYIKNMIVGAAQMDGAVLVVGADEGPMPQTREHLILARQVNVPAVVVFLNKVDLVAEEELLELVELEVRELLTRCGFPGAEVPVVRGQARAALDAPEDPAAAAGIVALLEAMDGYIPVPERREDLPFLMPVEKAFHIDGLGTVVTGLVERGVLRTGQKVQLVGLRAEPLETTCTGIEKFNKVLDEARAGDSVGLRLRSVELKDVRRGQVVAVPGSVASCRRFRAQVYLLNKDEGGRHTPVFAGYQPQFFFRTTSVTGNVRVLAAEGGQAVDMGMPGDHVQMDVELRKDAPVAMAENLRFAIREGNRTVGQGVVTAILE
ncbi:MAG: elongation factor Tu [Planctomycetes bacterium]|nr:elongation factor Tu [Planctomycetota bacterium]